MHPVDEFAALKSEIKRLETRAGALRDLFLAQGVPQGSNRHEVIVRQQSRRVLVPDRLPDAIRRDPRYWEVRTSQLVTLRFRPAEQQGPVQASFQGLEDDDDPVLVE